MKYHHKYFPWNRLGLGRRKKNCGTYEWSDAQRIGSSMLRFPAAYFSLHFFCLRKEEKKEYWKLAPVTVILSFYRNFKKV